MVKGGCSGDGDGEGVRAGDPALGVRLPGVEGEGESGTVGRDDRGSGEIGPLRVGTLRGW